MLMLWLLLGLLHLFALLAGIGWVVSLHHLDLADFMLLAAICANIDYWVLT